MSPQHHSRAAALLVFAAALFVGCVGSNDDTSDQILDVSRNGSVVNDPIPEIRVVGGKRLGTITLTVADGPSQLTKQTWLRVNCSIPIRRALPGYTSLSSMRIE